MKDATHFVIGAIWGISICNTVIVFGWRTAIALTMTSVLLALWYDRFKKLTPRPLPAGAEIVPKVSWSMQCVQSDDNVFACSLTGQDACVNALSRSPRGFGLLYAHEGSQFPVGHAFTPEEDAAKLLQFPVRHRLGDDEIKGGNSGN